MGELHKTAETGHGSIPIEAILHNKGFEKAAQDVGGVKKQIGMVVAWGFHADEKQFTEDVARYLQKAKGERDITVHELKPAIKALDMISEKYDKTGKDYSYRKQMSLQRKGHFQIRHNLEEMRKLAEERKGGVVIDLHYASIQHDPKFFMMYSTSNPAPKVRGLENNAPLTWVIAYTREGFDEYSKIPRINVVSFDPDMYSVVAPEPIRRIDRLRAFLDSGYKLDQSPLETAKKKLAGYYPVTIEGFVLHEPHKQGESCELSKELYEKVVAATGDAVIRIYDHFNSKMLKKEQPAKVLKTSAGNVTLEPAENNSLKKLSKEFEMYDVKLQPVGSEERIRTGYTSFAYYRAGIDEDKIYDMNARMALELLRDRLSKGEMIANITTFYPFEDSSMREKFERKGIGTAILNELLEEFKSRGAVGVSCWTDKEGMRHRLEKTGFQELGGNVYFKKL